MPNELPPIPATAANTSMSVRVNGEPLPSPVDCTSPLLPPPTGGADQESRWSGGRWRRPLGLLLLLITVVLWTASSFLASVGHTRNTQEAMADNYADFIRRQYLLQAILCHLRQYLLLRPPSLPDRHTTGIERPGILQGIWAIIQERGNTLQVYTARG